MDIQEIFKLIVEGVELAQKSGVLTLNDAYIAKISIDSIKSGKNLKTSFYNLTQVINIGQKHGAYSLQDSHYLYLATSELLKFDFKEEEETEGQAGTNQTEKVKKTPKK